MTPTREAARILAELHDVLSHVSEEALDAAASHLLLHDRIFFCGAGRSGLMLRALAMRLAQMGRCVYVAGDALTPAIGPGDLLVVASASGSTPSVCRNARIALDAGASLLVITAADASPLADLHPADIRIPAPHKNAAGESQPMGSLFEQALLLLGDALVLRMAPDPLSLRARHANLE